MHLKQLIEAHKAMVVALEQMDSVKYLPENDYTIADAMSKLKMAFPDRHVSLSLEIDYYSNGRTQVEWRAYVAEQEAMTRPLLTDAINAVLEQVKVVDSSTAMAKAEELCETSPY